MVLVTRIEACSKVEVLKVSFIFFSHSTCRPETSQRAPRMAMMAARAKVTWRRRRQRGQRHQLVEVFVVLKLKIILQKKTETVGNVSLTWTNTTSFNNRTFSSSAGRSCVLTNGTQTTCSSASNAFVAQSRKSSQLRTTASATSRNMWSERTLHS